MKTGREALRHQEAFGEIYSLRLGGDGRTLLTTGGHKSGAAHLYRLPQGLWPKKDEKPLRP
jgi:hypothetical protein